MSEGLTFTNAQSVSAKKSALNIVIPMKGVQRAKQRLKHVLSVSQRETLALTLYTNTLRFVTEHYSQYGLLVVTDDDYIASFAGRFGANVLLEPQSALGLNAALKRATQWSLARGFDHQLIMPADIGELDKRELDAVIEAGFYGHDVVIARAKDLGTNALMTTPPDAILPSFGARSSLTHAKLAKQQSHRIALLDLEKLSLDIDVSSDLARWSMPLSSQALNTKEMCHE